MALQSLLAWRFTLKGTAPAGLSDLVFESLLIGNLEEPTTAYGLLAEDVDVAPDHLSATFRIRDNDTMRGGFKRYFWKAAPV